MSGTEKKEDPIEDAIEGLLVDVINGDPTKEQLDALEERINYARRLKKP